MNVASERGDIKIKTAQWMILLVERKEPKQKKLNGCTLCTCRGYFYRSRHAAKTIYCGYTHTIHNFIHIFLKND